MSDIRVSNLVKEFPGKQTVRAVDDVSFTVNRGEMLVLLGPSGCGKTTTLRCLSGLERPTRGSVELGDRLVFDAERRVNVPANRRDIGLVFQTFALWPHLTAAKNIEFPLRARKVRSYATDAVENVARMVDLDASLLAKRPGALSGGQQQRVALARALVAEPAVILFDEPLSNLDALLREQLRLELRTLHRRIGFTGVYVTHDLAEAATIGDRIAVMRSGRLEQLGSPAEVFDSPRSPAVGRLLGLRRLCALRVTAGEWECTSANGSIAVRAPATRQHDLAEVDLYVRPDRLSVRRGGASGRDDAIVLAGGLVEEHIPIGSTSELIVRVGQQAVRINQVSHEAWRPGDRVDLGISWDNAHFFAGDQPLAASDLFRLERPVTVGAGAQVHP
jgi:iron(III) transport system ATP-binding protein